MSDKLSLLEKHIEDLFGEEPFNQVDEELFKWLIFSYFEQGNGIKDLDGSMFEQFKGKLFLLIEAVYQRHQERQK